MYYILRDFLQTHFKGTSGISREIYSFSLSGRGMVKFETAETLVRHQGKKGQDEGRPCYQCCIMEFFHKIILLDILHIGNDKSSGV